MSLLPHLEVCGSGRKHRQKRLHHANTTSRFSSAKQVLCDVFARRWPFNGDRTSLIRCLIRLDALSGIAVESDVPNLLDQGAAMAIGYTCIFLCVTGHVLHVARPIEPAHNMLDNIDMDDPYFYLESSKT